MDIFEYLMVMVSIILGIGVTQTLRGFGRMVRSERRDGVVALWGLVIFILHLQVWWGLWDMRVVESWTQPLFVLVVALPCMLFGATELLFPFGDLRASSWGEHFDQVHPWLLGMLAAFSALALFESWFILSVPLTHPYRAMQLTLTLMLLGGVFVKSRRLHLLLAIAFIGIFLSGQLLFRYGPQALVQ